eukprot:5926708-Pleurochrysis_carterae.AAC.1
MVSALYLSPPGRDGSANGTRPENFRKSAHHSSAVASFLWSAASLTRFWNACLRSATPAACSA